MEYEESKFSRTFWLMFRVHSAGVPPHTFDQTEVGIPPRKTKEWGFAPNMCPQAGATDLCGDVSHGLDMFICLYEGIDCAAFV